MPLVYNVNNVELNNKLNFKSFIFTKCIQNIVLKILKHLVRENNHNDNNNYNNNNDQLKE